MAGNGTVLAGVALAFSSGIDQPRVHLPRSRPRRFRCSHALVPPHHSGRFRTHGSKTAYTRAADLGRYIARAHGMAQRRARAFNTVEHSDVARELSACAPDDRCD